MSWWSWLLFWILVTIASVGYLGWRVWKLWPHARDFGRTLGEAADRMAQARDATGALGGRDDERRSRATGSAVQPMTGPDGGEPLAWDTPAATWREQRRREKNRARQVKLDDHAAVWATWRKPVE